MARIKINDLPKDMKISRKELGRIFGGRGTNPPVEESEYGGTINDKLDGFVDANPDKVDYNIHPVDHLCVLHEERWKHPDGNPSPWA